jgi:hypothetical protein
MHPSHRSHLAPDFRLLRAFCEQAARLLNRCLSTNLNSSTNRPSSDFVRCEPEHTFASRIVEMKLGYFEGKEEELG